MALAERQQTGRRLLLASDVDDENTELARILENAGSVESISIFDLPDHPASDFSGVIVDIDLTSAEAVQRVRKKLTGKAYQSLPRLFVLADSLHHGSAQAWALGATDTIQRPFDPDSILHRIRHAFPETRLDERATNAKVLNAGIAAAQAVLVKMFDRLPAGIPLTIDDVMKAESDIIKALRKCSLKEWLHAVNKHHKQSYRHILLVTGYATAFSQYLGMREDDQRRIVRAALVHDVGKAFVPTLILDKAELTPDEDTVMASHARMGYDALVQQGGFPAEVLDVVLHHHEMLDGTGYPEGLKADRISDITRVITLVDTYASLMEPRGDMPALSAVRAFAILESLEGKIDAALLHAFRPVAFGA
jgi:HD-GYP domain-containing protein (c-di-GMP phosphodiesterase class II)